MMLQELKRESIRHTWWLIVVGMILSISLGSSCLGDLRTLLMGKQELDVMTAEQIVPGTYVEGTVYGIYDAYAGTTEERDGVEREISCEYVIPVGEAEYMGLVVSEKDIAKCDALMQESWAYLDGTSDEINGQFKVKGTILDMDAESLQYYQEYLREYADYENLTANEQAAFLPYYLKAGYIGEHTFTEMALMTGLSALVLCMGVLCLILLLTGSGQRSVKKYCRENNAQEKVERFYESTVPVNGMRVSRDYLMGRFISSTVFFPSEQLLWACTYVMSYKLFLVIPFGKICRVELHMKDGKCLYHDVRSESQANEVLMEIQKTLPWVMIGSSEELERMYKNNREEMIRLCEEARAQSDHAI